MYRHVPFRPVETATLERCGILRIRNERVIQRSLAGASPALSFKGLSRAKLRRDRWVGIAAGALLFVAMV